MNKNRIQFLMKKIYILQKFKKNIVPYLFLFKIVKFYLKFKIDINDTANKLKYKRGSQDSIVLI